MNPRCNFITLIVTSLFFLSSLPAFSEEGGSGHYLPGAMSSFMDGVAPKESVLLRYNFLWYEGAYDRNKSLPIAGLKVVGVEAKSYANGATFFWRPSSFELGENLSFAMSATIPYVSLTVSGSVETDARSLRRTDKIQGIGDIVVMPFMLNQTISKDFSINYRVGMYAPTGKYQLGRLANTGKNYWTVEPTVGFMYLGQTNGREASLFAGVDFNTTNDATDYKTGTQMHLDGVLAQHMPMFDGLIGFGLNGYWYEQLKGDSGTGATFGSFKGQTIGLGPVLSFITKMGDVEVLTELKWLHEFETRNRLEGDYVWYKMAFKF